MRKPNILIITFEGILSPIFKSQFKPLILNLSHEINFTIIAIERHAPAKKQMIKEEKKYLENHGITCYPVNLLMMPLRLTLITNVLIITAMSLIFMLLRPMDILHIRRYDSILTALLAAFILRKKIIFDPRGLFIDEMLDSKNWRKKDIIYKIYRFFERKIINVARVIIVVSKPFKEYLEKRSGLDKVKIKLVPNCVDTHRFHAARSKPSFYKAGRKIRLIYIGGTSHWHMIDDMLEFFLHLKKHCGVFFHFLTYENHDMIRHKFKDKGLSPNEFKISSVPHEQVPFFLNQADAGFALIRSSLAKFICAPIKFGEYLAAGLPVIINRDIGETTEIIKKYKVGILYEPREIEKCVKSLVDLLNTEKIHENCITTADKLFSIKIAITALRSVYQYVLSQH